MEVISVAGVVALRMRRRWYALAAGVAIALGVKRIKVS